MHSFVIAGIIFAVGALTPGPDFLIIARNALRYSCQTAIFTILGVGMGIAVHLSYILLGLGLVITKSIVLFSLLKYAGAAYLIYLGAKSLNAQSHGLLPTETARTDDHLTPMEATRMGFLTNVLNPKVSLFLLAFFTEIISPESSAITRLGYGIEMLLISVCSFALMAHAVTRRPIRRLFDKASRRVEQTFGVLLIGLGIKVATVSK